MLSFDSINGAILDSIAARIGRRLQSAPIDRLTNAARLGLAETLAIAELPAHAANGEPGVPNFRGRWFHLLKSGPRYVGHALSTPIGPEATDWMIEGVFRSDLAAHMAICLRWIDKHIKGRGTIRMLAAPEHHLHALTITSGGDIRVVVAHLPRRTTTLRKRKIYSWTDFVMHLQASTPVRGVEPCKPRRTRKLSSPPRSARQRRKSSSAASRQKRR